MAVKFTYHGGMSVTIQRSDGFKIVCDPFLSQNPAAKTDPEELYDAGLVLVTHAAFDHYGDTAAIVNHSSCVLMAGADVVRLVNAERDTSLPPERVRLTIYGDEQHFGPTKVHTVTAFHTSNTVQNGVQTVFFPFGFIVEVEPGVVYYHAGDTSLFSDMKLFRELYKPNVMAVGISRISPEYACEMMPREAAYATSWVGPDVVIPTHYAPGSADLEQYLQLAQVMAPNTKVIAGANKSFMFTPFEAKELP